jgi:hypothetical protein
MSLAWNSGKPTNRFWPSGEAKSVNEDDHETVFHIFGNNDVMIFTKLVNMQNNSVHTSHRQNPRTKPLRQSVIHPNGRQDK